MSEQLVANELLAFLQQKLDVMDEVSAMQICSTSFSQDDIASSKQLLFRLLNKGDQMVSHRRDGTQKSLQEIITLLKETDPDDVPTFVARDLNKLPPVTFDHVDVTCLLKDILSLKKSLADLTLRFDVSQNTVAELRNEVTRLRDSLAVSRSPDVAFVNARRGAYLNASADDASAFSTPPSATPDKSATCVAAPPAARSPRTPAPLPARAAPAKAAPPPTPPRPNFATVVAAPKPARAPQRPVPSKAPTEAPACARADNQDGDGFVKVVRKKRTPRATQNRCGKAPTGPNFLLRAETPTTAVYISRLHHSTEADNIIEYLRVKTKYTLRVQHLESRHNASFKAFVVRVPTNWLPTVMQDEFWPEGVVYRRFRGRVPTPEKGHNAVSK